MAKLNINGKIRDVRAESDTPLLWVIREQVGLTGTKYGCGVAQCGACSVHLNGEVVRSCSIPVSAVKPTDKIVTIDWTVRDNVRAQLRVIVKRILRKYGYPPDKQEKATQTVLEQAEVLSAGWAAV